MRELINKFLNILLSGVVPAILSLALLYFLWGLYSYLSSAGDSTKRREGISVMIRGIVALTIMLSVWGLVAVISSFFGSPIGIPQF